MLVNNLNFLDAVEDFGLWLGFGNSQNTLVPTLTTRTRRVIYKS